MCERCSTGLFSDSVFHERIIRDCQKPFDHEFSYVTSWSDLEASVDCHWCQLILSYDKTPRTKDEVKVDVAFWKRQDGWAIPFGTQFINVSVDGERHISGDIYAAPDDPAADYIVARPPLLDVNTPHAHSLVLRAIEDCIARHECCPSPRDQLLPIRLIDCTDPWKPKLVETEGRKGRYAALSYVWGESQVHSTTSSNIFSYLSGINISMLPRTITDAISLTKNLKINYLWVDSLCIIQDSDEDKKKQMGQMRRIYNDAYLTIVAASATKVSEGFLQTRAPPVPPDTQLAFQLPGGKGVGTFHFYISIKNGEGQEKYHPSMEPVSKRGWCLQEFMLSPRALVFTSQTMQYHCQDDMTNIGDSYHPTYIARLRFPDVVYAPSTGGDANSTMTSPPRISPSSQQWNAVRQGWSTAVGDYTRRSITVPGDKLRAFAGVAELFHRARGTAYLAGLWEDTLLEDLLWETQLDEGELLPRPAEYRAPSWSWASIDSDVKSGIDGMYRDYGEATWCERVSCDVTLADADLPFDCVTAAVLVLHGAVFKASLLSLEEGRRLVYSLPPPEEKVSRITVDDDSQSYLSKAECIGTAYLDSSDDLHLEEVWALPMKWSEPGRSVNGLILALSGPDTTDESRRRCGQRYRRIGYLRTSGFTPENSHWIEWIDGVETEDIVIV
ncbi:heterokaryon incompatibility protein-domain-containing protein [Biscogniauxia mediterranea]|nr:heterokaryon incompatibility protein-domain-containing protein [Biscogniauxia mediterranea]